MNNVRISIAGIIFLALTSVAAQDLQARFDKSLSAARALTDVEVRSTDTIWIKDFVSAHGPDLLRTFEYSYVASGQKYRTTRKLLSGSLTNLAKLFESGFDGTSYFTYEPDTRYMTLAKNGSQGDRGANPKDPLVAPFMFLSKDSDECVGCALRFTDITAPGFANGLILPKGKMVDGFLEIDIPGPSVGKQRTAWHIDLDSAGDAFTPRIITWVIEGAKVKFVYKLSEYTNLAAYPFPTRVETTEISSPRGSPPSVIGTGLTAVVSMRVPEVIEDSVFERDPLEKEAVTVWDSDRKKLSKMAPNLAKVPVKAGAARAVLLAMITLTVLMVGSVIWKSFASKPR